jgi:hypothetical protein
MSFFEFQARFSREAIDGCFRVPCHGEPACPCREGDKAFSPFSGAIFKKNRRPLKEMVLPQPPGSEREGGAFQAAGGGGNRGFLTRPRGGCPG